MSRPRSQTFYCNLKSKATHSRVHCQVWVPVALPQLHRHSWSTPQGSGCMDVLGSRGGACRCCSPRVLDHSYRQRGTCRSSQRPVRSCPRQSFGSKPHLWEVGKDTRPEHNQLHRLWHRPSGEELEAMFATRVQSWYFYHCQVLHTWR